MTHPSDAPRDARQHADQHDGARGHLVLDEGETLETRIDGGEVTLRLPAARAYDLSHVLDA
jgi:hypothetical protein